MSGALLQLASIGSQDPYFTSNPQITLFKKKYMKYTNFATETVRVDFDGGKLSFGSSQGVILDNSGDLINKIVLVIKLDSNNSKTWGYVNKLGHAIIDNITISIGGTEIDSISGEFINIYHELYRNSSHDTNYDKMIGNVPEMKRIDVDHPEYTLYIPLNFWLCKTSYLAFPTCALNNQDFQINVTLSNALDCINYKGDEPLDLPTINSSYFLIDYIYLENEERNLFKTNGHTYLIETVQEIEDTITSQISRINLTFDRPSKYIIWTSNLNRFYERNRFLTYSFDDDFEKLRNEFGKLVWLSTRDGLNMTEYDKPKIEISNTFLNINESIQTVINGNIILQNLASKVKGIILFAENINNIIVCDATTENVILTENNITFEDMSITIDSILEEANTTTSQELFLNYHAINVRDQFNYSNFINRKDNPIVRTQLLLNGREKFKEMDGNYFNYIVPYYYFDNTPSDGVNVFTFAVNPMSVEPSGTINFGQINDNKELIINVGKNNNITNDYFNNYYESGRIKVYSYNYALLNVYPQVNTVTLT